MLLVRPEDILHSTFRVLNFTLGEIFSAKHVVLSWPLTCSWVPHLLLQPFPSLRFMRSFSGLDCKWNHFTISPGTTNPNLYAVFGWRHVSGTFWKVSPGAISRTPSLFKVFSHLLAVIPDLPTFIPDILALGLQPVTLKDLPALEIGWLSNHGILPTLYPIQMHKSFCADAT